MFDDLADHKTRYHAKITASTLDRIGATLRRALNAAIARGYLTDNPARLLDLPSPRRIRPVTWSEPRVAALRRDGTRPRIAVWTPQQLATFLTAVAEDDLFALWWLAGPAPTPPRRAGRPTLDRHRLDRRDPHHCPDPGRTPRHGRQIGAQDRRQQPTITLDPTTVTVLANHHRRQRRIYEQHGRHADERGFVFTWPDGRPIRPGWLTHRFAALVVAGHDRGLQLIWPGRRSRDARTTRSAAVEIGPACRSGSARVQFFGSMKASARWTMGPKSAG
jgi:hypothetical protein